MKTFIKILFTVALIYFLTQKGALSFDAFGIALRNYESVLGGLFFIFICSTLSIYRWNILLKSCQINLSIQEILRLAAIGAFFNMALPGAVSGDFVKAFLVGKLAKGKRTLAMSTLIVDRVTGLLGLLWIGGFAFLYLAFSGEIRSPILLSVRYLILGLLLINFFAFIYFAKVHDTKDLILKTLKRLQSWKPKLNPFLQIYLDTKSFREKPWTILTALGLSLVIHFSGVLGFYFFLKSFEPNLSISLSLMGALVPIGFLVVAVPILPGGIGTGHAAFSALFLLLNTKNGANVFNLFLVPQFSFALIGGLLYLLLPPKEKQKNWHSSCSTDSNDTKTETFSEASPRIS